MRHLIFLFIFLFSTSTVFSQERREKIKLDGEIVTVLITETDTILIADLDEMSVSSPRQFESKDDYRLYLKYRRYANKVYPYAKQSIRIFREVEEATQNMKPKKRKKHIKKLQKEYKEEFKGTLKNLSKTQGRVLITMIERELDTPFYDLLKGLRGGFVAGYWNQLGKLNGYRLKEGYIVGKEPILDAVLQDFDISHEL